MFCVCFILIVVFICVVYIIVLMICVDYKLESVGYFLVNFGWVYFYEICKVDRVIL